jgi:hypothetical protein
VSRRNGHHAGGRERIAREAARLMVEGGIDDYQFVKKKAASRLQITDKQAMPSNEEIEAEVSTYQRLFRAQSQPKRLQALRRVALDAMRFLVQFQPRLVGSLLRGTADEHSAIHLHLFSEPNEAVGLFLMDNAMPYEVGERTLRLSPTEQRVFPTCSFVAADVAIELVVFDLNSQRNPPLCPVAGKPMKRANLTTVSGLTDGAG